MNDFVAETPETAPVAKGKPGRKPKMEARERSSSGLSVDQAHDMGLNVTGEGRDPNEKVEQERVRIPLNSGQKQSLRGYKLDWDNYHYRWFHESQTRGGRVAEALEAFYEHCTNPSGDNIKTPSGAGFDYLMRLPKKYWNQDVEASRARRNSMRAANNQISGNDKLQEYGIDTKTGERKFSGENPVKRSTSTSHNPYAD
jgi:hypothetical protein